MEVNVTSNDELLRSYPIVEKLEFVVNVTAAELKGWLDLVIEKPHNAEGRSSLRPDCYPAAIKNFSIPQLWVNMVAEKMTFSAVSEAGDGDLQLGLDQALSDFFELFADGYIEVLPAFINTFMVMPVGESVVNGVRECGNRTF